METIDVTATEIHKQVLVVDDDSALRGLILKRLRRLGFDVLEAATGANAIEQVATSSAELLLLIDQVLPDMAGSEVIQSLNARGLKNPFIVMTGQGDERLAVQMMKQGAEDYLIKDTGFLDILPEVLERVFRGLDTEQRLKKAEQSLRASEERFRKAFTISPDSVNINRLADGAYIAINQGFTQIMGYTEAEVAGKTSLDLQIWANPEDRQRLVEGLRTNGVVHNLEARFRTKNGDEKDGLMSASVIELDGELHILSVTRDISERKRMEDIIHKSRNMLHLVLDTVPQRVFWKDRQGYYLGCNMSFARSIGMEHPNQVVGKTDFDLADTPQRAEAYRADDRAILDKNQGKRHVIERFEHANSPPTWLDSTKIPLADESGSAFGVLGVLEDVTERKRSEEELLARAERHRVILDTAMSGFWLADMQGRLLEVNQAYCQMSGYSAEELLSMRISDLDSQESAKDIAAHIQKLISQGQDRFETRHRRKDGTVFDVEVSTQYRPFREGQIVAFLQDITERKQAEDERNITIDLLSMLARPNNSQQLMKDVSFLLKNWSGCEAVGIRLQDGDDFPYYTTSGFPEKFVRAERYLCARDFGGKPILDSEGNPILECMCGNVICGRFNPALPFFTANGSFWTNSTTDLLASTSEQDRQARTRNRCNGEGYESVALIPLRHSGQNLGLLQFNDFRKNRFDRNKIALLERLAANLSLALIQRQTAESLREKESLLSASLSAIDQPFAIINADDYSIALANEAGGGAQRVGKKCYGVLHQLNAPCSGRDHQCPITRIRQTGKPFVVEHLHADQHAQPRHVEIHAYPIFDAQNNLKQIVEYNIDITERKRAEAQLRLQSLVLEQIQDQVTVTDLKGNITYINQAEVEILGYTRDELIGASTEKYGDDSGRGATQREILEKTLENGHWRGEVVNQTAGGKHIILDCRTQVVFDDEGKAIALCGISTDITDTKRKEAILEARVRLTQHSFESSIQEFMQKVLDEAELLTESKIGFFHFVDDDGKSLLLQAWSTNTLANMCTMDAANLHYPVEKAGMWADAVRDGQPHIYNDYVGHPLMRGLSEGHAAVTRFISMPISQNGKVLAILGVGNKANGYDKDDVDTISQLLVNVTEVFLRKRAEDSLRANEERLRLALAAANQGLYDLNLKTGEATVNEEYARMLGYELSELKETTAEWMSRLHPDESEQITAMFYDYIAGKLPEYRVEYRQRAKTGEWKWILSVGKILEYDLNGNPVRMLGIYTDITERQKTQAKINQLYQTLVQSPVSVVITDLKGDIEYVNPKFCEITGYSQEEAIGQNPRILKSGEFSSEDYKELWETIQSGREWRGEFHNKKKSGELFWESATISAVKNQQDEITHYVAVKEDITERKRIENALIESERRFHAMFEKHNAVMLLIEPETGAIIDANLAAQKFYGYAPDEFKQLHIDNINMLSAQEIAEKRAEAAQRSGNYFIFPHRLATGESRIVEVHSSPITINAKTFLFSVIHDITERQRAEETLREREALLRIAGQTARFGGWSVDLATQKVTWSEQVALIHDKEPNYSPSIHEALQFYAPEWSDKITRVFNACAQSGTPYDEEMEIITARGRRAWVRAIGHAVWDRLGNIVGVRGSFQDITERKNSEQDIEIAYDSTLRGWSAALELREHETAGHSQRVVQVTIELARKMEVDEGKIIHIERGALLHDIGKMGIPDSILLKPAQLSEDEWVTMRQHPEFGYRMLSKIDYLKPALEIPYCHHEKWDGSGYPRGLKGEEIPLAARIFSIVDVWDALSHDRPYRPAWPREVVIEYLKKQSGKQFDPQVVEQFLEIVDSREIVSTEPKRL